MEHRKLVAHALAAAMLSGALTKKGLITRGAAVIGRRYVWLQRLVDRIIAEFGQGTRPRKYRLERFILNDQKFFRACERRSVRFLLQPRFRARMCPAAGPPRKWKVRPLRTIGELAEWLNLMPEELAWLADRRTQEQKLPEGRLRHYLYRWQSKRTGSARLIESPKQLLKLIQRRLLREILDRIPPHEAAHGFRRQRSVRSFVEPHIKRDVVLKLDLKDFFPRILRARIIAIFLTAGYPESVSEFLAGLCTNSTPGKVVKEYPAVTNPVQLRQMKLLYQRPHLPQGAPTSPSLANLAAYRFDCRLAGLARALGVNYTRYADDLIFSGGKEFERDVDRFYIRVCAIALEEGFEVQTRKTRIMRQSVSQQAGGVVLNQWMNVRRNYYERLKAILHNCIVHGPGAQNRHNLADFRAHLLGQISHVENVNPARGNKLRTKFDRISWDAPQP
jgi:Reverse transcriptase (RNA-dependent DNA polymerase).